MSTVSKILCWKLIHTSSRFSLTLVLESVSSGLQLATCCDKLDFTVTQPQPLVSVLSLAAFMPQGQRRVAATETCKA